MEVLAEVFKSCQKEKEAVIQHIEEEHQGIEDEEKWEHMQEIE